MAIRFRCPCGEKVKAHEGAEGRHIKCPHCQAVLRVPDDGKSTYDTVGVAVALTHSDELSGSAMPAGSAEPKPAEVSADAAPAKVLILVADSNARDRRMTAQILQEHNYVVLEAADGPKALELIRAERPAAAVLNVKLDILSGFQVVQQLRSPSNALNKDVLDDAGAHDHRAADWPREAVFDVPRRARLLHEAGASVGDLSEVGEDHREAASGVN